VSRLVQQKGFDLCFDVLPEMLAATDARLVVLGSGERRYEDFFAGLQVRFPRRACYHRGYHDELAHGIEAASDVFLMPSLYEPCGLNQMFGMKYGTIPVVRKPGGLADSVRPFDRATGEGTGFVFEHATPEGLRWALGQALACYRDSALWSRLVANAMREDFSWENQVVRYETLYSRMLRR
jgi:starch synthase